MSVQAIVWALEEAPLSKASHLATLLALANEADSEGNGAFPSQRTIAWQTRKSDRAVRDDLKAMVKDGVIKPGDQERAAYIPADRRPVVYDLCMERTRDMSKRPNPRPVSGWDGKHRSTDDVDRADDGSAGSVLPPDPEPQVETAGSVLPGGSTASDRAEVQRQTGRKQASDDPGINPEINTHTPAREQAPTDDEVEADTGVCVVDSEDEKAIVDVLRLNLVTRAPASKQNDEDDAKKTIVAKAKMCFNAGATIEEIDAALSAKIDTDTRYPINVGVKALRSLLARKQGRDDPFGAPESTPEPSTSALVDADGRVWPRSRIHERPCRGGSCHDISGKHYVSIIAPSLGAFSCSICKDVYEKEGRLG